MGILLSLLRPSHHTRPTSKPSISHPYPLGSNIPASPRMAPTRSRSVRSIRSIRNNPFPPHGISRRLSHRGGEEGEEGLRRLLSPSPDDQPSIYEAGVTTPTSYDTSTSTFRSRGRLRKVLKVDDGWDLVRDVDLDGYGHGHGYSHDGDARGG